MTDTKFTPGPWVASNNHSGDTWRVESDADGYPNDGWVIASEFRGPDAQSNAVLTAAAPELLDALELADATLRGANMDRNAVERKVVAALAKARGEMPAQEDTDNRDGVL